MLVILTSSIIKLSGQNNELKNKID